MYPYIRIKILFLKLMAGDNAHNSFREGKQDIKLHIAKYPNFVFFKTIFPDKRVPDASMNRWVGMAGEIDSKGCGWGLGSASTYVLLLKVLTQGSNANTNAQLQDENSPGVFFGALTGNRTEDLSENGTVLNQLSHTGQGQPRDLEFVIYPGIPGQWQCHVSFGIWVVFVSPSSSVCSTFSTVNIDYFYNQRETIKTIWLSECRQLLAKHTKKSRPKTVLGQMDAVSGFPHLEHSVASS